jgi:hypothetical protein
MSSYLGSVPWTGWGYSQGEGQVQTRHYLGLMSLLLQVGLVRNVSGNDHIVGA